MTNLHRSPSQAQSLRSPPYQGPHSPRLQKLPPRPQRPPHPSHRPRTSATTRQPRLYLGQRHPASRHETETVGRHLLTILPPTPPPLAYRPDNLQVVPNKGPQPSSPNAREAPAYTPASPLSLLHLPSCCLHRPWKSHAIPTSESTTRLANIVKNVPYTPLLVIRVLARLPCKICTPPPYSSSIFCTTNRSVQRKQ